MKTIRICDITLKQKEAAGLTFKEKLDFVQALDRLHTDFIEFDKPLTTRTDSLSLKAILQTLQYSRMVLPVALNETDTAAVQKLLGEARSPRLQLSCPVSSVQMEYLYHCKPDVMKQKLLAQIGLYSSICNDIEFVAQDATRSDPAFLSSLLSAVLEAGVKTITLCDYTGALLPQEVRALIERLYTELPGLKDATLGLELPDTYCLATACCYAAMEVGVDLIKTVAIPCSMPRMDAIVRLTEARKNASGFSTGIETVTLEHTLGRIQKLVTAEKAAHSPFENGVQQIADVRFTLSDTEETIEEAISSLGYDLGAEDLALVYENFVSLASTKENVSLRELDALVASTAMQVPPVYTLGQCLITTGNVMGSTAHIRLLRGDETLESVCIGSGPIGAGILAIEQITGHHYELDDFQIQSLTEGREAIGETIIKLRADGKVYSGRGLSTDIVASGIQAYLSALNKIAYEENRP